MAFLQPVFGAVAPAGAVIDPMITTLSTNGYNLLRSETSVEDLNFIAHSVRSAVYRQVGITYPIQNIIDKNQISLDQGLVAYIKAVKSNTLVRCPDF